MANYFSYKSTAVQSSGGFYDIGTILPWTKATVLDGFLLCDGSSRTRTGEFADLFAVIGTTYGVGSSSDNSTFSLPNLLGRAIIGEGTSNDGTTTRAFNIGESSGATNVTSNVSFPSATVTISGTNLTAPIATAAVPLPAHTHYMFTANNNRPSNGTVNSSSTNQNKQVVHEGSGGNAGYIMRPDLLSATGGLTSTAGSGTGEHNHTTQAVVGNVSFDQTNLNATNTGSTISPYGVCRYIIKAKQL